MYNFLFNIFTWMSDKHFKLHELICNSTLAPPARISILQKMQLSFTPFPLTISVRKSCGSTFKIHPLLDHLHGYSQPLSPLPHCYGQSLWTSLPASMPATCSLLSTQQNARVILKEKSGKTVWGFLKQWHIEYLYDPAILLLSICQENWK